MTVKRAMAWSLALLMMISSALAESPYWSADLAHAGSCKQSRQGCEVLQMVLMGRFAGFDRTDNLSRRVFSAVLPMLLAVTQEDFDHFCVEFNVSQERARELYYIAMGNCLWADILLAEDTEADGALAAARVVLLLFLDPGSSLYGQEQIATIRAEMDDADIAGIADTAGLPFEFVKYLMTSEDWKTPTAQN